MARGPVPQAPPAEATGRTLHQDALRGRKPARCSALLPHPSLQPPSPPPACPLTHASYLTAAFAKLVCREGAPGKAIGIEHIPQLTRWAAAAPRASTTPSLWKPTLH